MHILERAIVLSILLQCVCANEIHYSYSLINSVAADCFRAACKLIGVFFCCCFCCHCSIGRRLLIEKKNKTCHRQIKINWFRLWCKHSETASNATSNRIFFVDQKWKCILILSNNANNWMCNFVSISVLDWWSFVWIELKLCLRCEHCVCARVSNVLFYAIWRGARVVFNKFVYENNRF